MKDIITCMLQAKPLHRPAICEVLAHPWFAGELPEQAAIMKEFQERDDLVRQKLEAQRQERKKLKEATVSAMNAASSNNRSGEELPLKPIDLYDGIGNDKTSFLSKLSPDIIEEALITYLSQKSVEIKQKENKYQVDFNFQLV